MPVEQAGGSGSGSDFDPSDPRQLAAARTQQTQMDAAARQATLAASTTTGIQQREQVIGPQALVNADTRQNIQAAIGFHLGHKYGSLRWSELIPKMTDRFIEMTGGDPTLAAAVADDVNTLYALTDQDIARMVTNGQPVSGFGDVWDAMAEIAWEVGAQGEATLIAQENSKAVKGEFDGLTLSEVAAVTGTEVGGKKGEVVQFGGETVAVSSLAGLFGTGAWSYDQTSNVLAVTYGPEGAQHTVGVRPRPGFNPHNHLDVLTEIVVNADNPDRFFGETGRGGLAEGLIGVALAAADKLGSVVDGNPQLTETLDGLWDTFGEAVAGRTGANYNPNPTEGPLARSARIKTETRANILAGTAIIRFPTEAAIALLADSIIRENDAQGLDVAPSDALTQAADLVSDPKIRSDLVTEYQNLTSEELIAQLDTEGKGFVRSAAERGLAGAMNVMETYDEFTQWLGLNAIDFVGDLGSGALGVLFASDKEEAFQHFSDAFNETVEFGTKAADYWGLEGAAADLANLAVGLGFDPVNYLFPGAKGARKLFYKAMTNPKYAEIWVKAGGVRSVTRVIAETVGDKALANVMYLAAEGVSDDGIRSLFALARSETATIADVEKVLLKELPSTDGVGWFVGAGPNRAIRQDTINAFARTVDSLSRGKLPDEAMRQIFDLTGQLSKTRTFELGENMSLGQFSDLLQMFHPDDMGTAVKWMDEAINAAPRTSRAAKAGVKAAEKQEARGKLVGVGRHRRAATAEFDLKGARANRDALVDSLRKVDSLALDDAGKNRVRTVIRRQARTLSDDIAAAEARVGNLDNALAATNKQLSLLTRTEGSLATQPARQGMAEVVYRYYEDLAGQINTELSEKLGKEAIPVVTRKGRPVSNPFAPEVPVRDWSAVTGAKKASFEEDLPLVFGLAGDDYQMAKELTAIGMFDRMQRVVLPASPYEVALYRKIASQSPLYNAWKKHKVTKAISHGIRGAKMAFGFNLLMNPITMAKVTLDETARFLADTGLLGSTLKSTLAGIPGAGAARKAVAAGVRGQARSAIELFPSLSKIPMMTKLENWSGAWVTNPWALAYQRTHEGFAAASHYQWVSPTTPGVTSEQYVRTSERWVNGTLIQSPHFKAYSRFLPDARELGAVGVNEYPVPQSFVDWWTVGDDATAPGFVHAKTSEVVVGGVSHVLETDAAFVWDTVQRSYNYWIDNFIEEGAKSAMRRRLIEAAGGRGIPRLAIEGPDVRLLKSLKQVPGLANQREGFAQMVVGPAFDAGFGNPSGRRGGVFFEHYFDEYQNIMRTAYTNKGRLVTKEMLVGQGLTEPDALAALAQGADNSAVRNLMDQTGAVTEQAIEAQAARYAKMRADGLMFRFTAGSLMGQGIEGGLLLPYARAQMDFVGWWAKHLTRPIQLRSQLAQRLPQQVVDGIQRVPINIRAWAKFAHLNSAVNNETPSPLDQMLDTLTFFPFKWDAEFFIDILPQLGPAPSWLLDAGVSAGLVSDEVLQALETVFPAAAFGAANEGFLDRLFPQSRRSVRDLSVSSIRGLAGVWGQVDNPDDWGGVAGAVFDWMSQGRVPSATGDFTSAAAGEFLNEHAFDSVPGSAAEQETTRSLVMEAADQANRNDWSQSMKDRLDPFSAQDKEYRALGNYAGLLTDDSFGILSGFGVFSTSDLYDVDGQPRIKAIYKKYTDGEATVEDKKYLADALIRVYFDAGRTPLNSAIPDFSLMDFMNIRHPELAVNLVSKNQGSQIPVRSAAHQEFVTKYVDPQTHRLKDIPPGPQGSQLVRDARRQGWIVTRQADGPDGWIRDAHEAVHTSARRALDAVWYYRTGREWSGRIPAFLIPQRITVDAWMKGLLEPIGVKVEVGQSMAAGELHDLLATKREAFKIEGGAPVNLLDRGPLKQLLEADQFGQEILSKLSATDSYFSKEQGIDSFEDWPEETRVAVRADFAEAINQGVIRLADYQSYGQQYFGEIDYQPPVPPPLGEVDTGIAITADQIRTGVVDVVDGDTLSLLTGDGYMRVRLIGINAPEATQTGYQEATDNLVELLAGASKVDLVVYKPDTFGLTQITAPGVQRLLMWLYVDGVPIYDPSVFTSSNPRGAGVGGTVLDLKAILEGANGDTRIVR